MSGDIVGRDEELNSIHALFDQTIDGPAALVLEGEAGIGKSTLWLAIVHRIDLPSCARRVFGGRLFLLKEDAGKPPLH